MANIEKIVLPDNTEYDINIPAGENNPIKDSVYIDSLNNEFQGVQFVKNGEKRATVSIGSATNSEKFVVARQNDSDTLLGGMQVHNNDNVLFANQGTIALRPNGVESATGQAYLKSNGDISFDGDIIDNSKGSIQFATGNVVLAPKTNGAIVLRPNGLNSNVNQFYIDGNGYIHSSSTYNRSAAASANVGIGSGGDFFRTTSLRAFKENIKDITEEDAEKGYELRPVSFIPKKTEGFPDISQHEQYGFIAEEVEEVLPNLATYTDDEELNGVAYDRVCAILLKQNQMLKAQVDTLEKRVEELERK